MPTTFINSLLAQTRFSSHGLSTSTDSVCLYFVYKSKELRETAAPVSNPDFTCIESMLTSTQGMGNGDKFTIPTTESLLLLNVLFEKLGTCFSPFKMFPSKNPSNLTCQKK